jgi:hypothetical protein
MYEVVGVEDAEDRKKLYFLIQRLQAVIKLITLMIILLLILL